MADWVFADPPNVAVLTTRSIVEAGEWIAQVFHDADDGAWQFHDSLPGPKSQDDATIVSLRSMVERDATLSLIADLPEGWCAWRTSPSAPWQRAPAD